MKLRLPRLGTQPVSALYFRQHSGICVHPNFASATSVYQEANVDAIVAKVAASGVGFVRGMFSMQRDQTDLWANALRAHDIKWLMTIVPEAQTNTSQLITNQTLAETRTKVARIRDEYADVCYALEGANEPNHNRDGSPIAPNWHIQAVDHQRAIWEEARGTGNPLASTIIVGPSMHDIEVENSNGQHWVMLKDQGILNYQDMAGLHTYPGGSFPTRKLDVGIAPTLSRLQHIYAAFGDQYPVFCTEWGYHNAMKFFNTPPISREAAGTYAPRAYLQFITQMKGDGTGVSGIGRPRNLHLTCYELMDDPDPNGDNSTIKENHSGMIAVQTTSPSTWSNKPMFTTLAAMLNAMRDPAETAAYTPTRVRCRVTSPDAAAKLQWQVIATKAQSNAGTATLWIYRDMEVWNRSTVAPVTVPLVDVDVNDRVGTRRIRVDGNVTRLDLR